MQQSNLGIIQGLIILSRFWDINCMGIFNIYIITPIWTYPFNEFVSW